MKGIIFIKGLRVEKKIKSNDGSGVWGENQIPTHDARRTTHHTQRSPKISILIGLMCFFVFFPNAVTQESEGELKESELPPATKLPLGMDIPLLDLTSYGRAKKLKEQPEIQEYSITLTIGEARAIQLPFDISRHTLVHAGLFKLKINKGLADPEGNPISEILLQAEKTGSTELRLYDTKQFLRTIFKLSVSTHNIKQIVTELRKLLLTVEGLHIKVIGERIFLDGEILVPRDIGRIQMVLQQYPMVINLTRLSPNTQNLYAARMEADIGKPEVRVRANQGRFIFEGFVNSAQEAKDIIKISETYIPPIYKPATGVKEAQTATIVNLLTVRPPKSPPPEKMIKVLIQYVELTKAFLRSFEFSFSPFVKDESKVSFDLEKDFAISLSGAITNLFPKLNKAVTLNHARIMNTVTLLVKNGAKSPGNVKTGINIPFTSGRTESGDSITSFVPVQSQTSVSARIVPGGDQIHLNLSIGVSDTTSPESPGGPPPNTVNEIKTEVLVGKGQSAAIGGVFKESMQRAFGRSPDGSSEARGVPIINMGKTRRYGHNKNQFIVFITPEVLATPNDIVEASKEFKRKFRLIREI